MFFDDNRNPGGEDYFSHTRMTFGEHIEALRWHLVRAIIGFGIALVFSFFIGKPAVEFIARPVREQLNQFQLERIAAAEAKLNNEMNQAKAEEAGDGYTVTNTEIDANALANGFDPPLKPKSAWIPGHSRTPKPNEHVQEVQKKLDALQISRAQLELLEQATLKSFTIMEAMMVWFKVCMYIALVLGSPWIFWQLWAFVAAGLYPNEKKLVHVYLPFSLLLFLVGVVFCQFVVIPRSIYALLWFNGWLGIEPELRLNDWLSFAIMLPVIFGLAFQTPLIMLFLERLGLVGIDTYRAKRKFAWFGLALFGAFILPTGDAFTFVLLWVPMIGLYELGILLCKLSPRRPLLDFGAPDESEEMVEV